MSISNNCHTFLLPPFGVALNGRNWSTEEYRYGFNEKEKDDEGLGGGGSTYDYGFRIYNASLGKFLSVDPITSKYAFYTPFQFAGNKPIIAVDIDGLEEFIRTQYFNAAGALYRTEIQVVSHISGSDADPFGLGLTQIIHETQVTVAPNGNATCRYIGTTTGNRIGAGSAANVGANAPGSSAFSLAENQSLFNLTATGTADAFGNPISRITSVFGALQKVVTSEIITLPNGSNMARVNRTGQPVVNDTYSNTNNIFVLNSAAAPANEPYLPVGFNVTPANSNNRVATPADGGGPINPQLTPNSSNLPVNRLLTMIAQDPGTTNAQPVGTTVQLPSRAAVQANGGRALGVANSTQLTFQ